MGLVGSWRAAQPDAGEHALYFGLDGELVWSSLDHGGTMRLLLTWERRGDQIAIDQPSAPRVDVVRFLLGSEDTLQLAGVWYVREREDFLDAEAPAFALAARASWHAVESAHPDAPFVPFLVTEGAGRRTLHRSVAESPDRAQRAAEELLGRETYERAVWSQDGRVTLADGTASDAVIVLWYGPGATRLRSSTLAYRFEGTMPRISGGLVLGP